MTSPEPQLYKCPRCDHEEVYRIFRAAEATGRRCAVQCQECKYPIIIAVANVYKNIEMPLVPEGQVFMQESTVKTPEELLMFHNIILAPGSPCQ